MKKILISILMMAMIAGCVQAPTETEKPGELPVVEQPEKPVETETIKKIDESKDWVYYTDTDNTEYYDYFEANLDEWLNVYVDPEKKGYPIFLNIDSEAADEYNDPSPTLDKDGNPIEHSGVYNWQVYSSAHTWLISKQYVSILSKAISGGHYQLGAYTFSLTNGKELNNDELLEIFELTRDKASQIAEDAVKARGCVSSLINSGTDYQCLYDEDTYDFNNFSIYIDDNSILYVDEDNHLNVILNIKIRDRIHPDLKISVDLNETYISSDNVKPVMNEDIEAIDMNKILKITNEPIDIQLAVDQHKDELFIQEPTLLWDSEDAVQFNENMSQLAQTCRDELTYHENGYWHTASLLNTKYYINDDILSIVVKLDRWLANAGVGPSEFMTYNFSLTTHKQLSNDEILEMYHVSPIELQEGINKQLEKDYLPCSAPVGEDGLIEKPCYGEYAGSKGGKYGDTSLIYIKDKMIHMYVNVHQAMYQENVDLIVYDLNEIPDNEKTLNELVTIQTTDISVTDQQREIIENWSFSYQLDKIQVHIQSDEIDEFNKQMAERYETYVNALRYNNDILREAHFMDIIPYLNQDILSLVIRDHWFMFETDLRPAEYEIVNIDIETGHILTNEELLKKLNIDVNNLYYMDAGEEVKVDDNTLLAVKDNQLYALESVVYLDMKALTFREMLKVNQR